MIAGVCGGIGSYFNVDPVLIRVVFVVLAIAHGFGLLLYIALAIVIPREPGPMPADDPESKAREFADAVERRADAIGVELRRSDGPLRRVLAWVIIALAAATLIGLFRPRGWGYGVMGDWYPLGMHWGWGILLPLLLVFAGIYLIIRPPRK